MIVTVGSEGDAMRFDLARPIDLSTSIVPNGSQPDAFGLPAASSAPFRAGSFVGDTRAGGPVNCSVLTLAPHGNGTHAESAAHVAHTEESVARLIGIEHMVATIVTVPLRRRGDVADQVTAARSDDEAVIARDDLADALQRLGGPHDALVIRHAPAHEVSARSWSRSAPPYPTDDAVTMLAAAPLRAILLDVPSIDRAEDDGALRNHRTWWGIPPSGHDGRARHPDRIIVEMVAVPHDVPDGVVLVGISVARIQLDALPARVVAWPRVVPHSP